MSSFPTKGLKQRFTLKREISSRTLVSPIFTYFRLGAELSFGARGVAGASAAAGVSDSELVFKAYEALRKSDDTVYYSVQ